MDESTNPRCPACQRRMVLRQNSAYQRFWGCQQFPRCDATRDYKLRDRDLLAEIDEFGLGVFRAALAAYFVETGYDLPFDQEASLGRLPDNFLIGVQSPADAEGMRAGRVALLMFSEAHREHQTASIEEAIEFFASTTARLDGEEIALERWFCTNVSTINADIAEDAETMGIRVFCRADLSQLWYDENIVAQDLASTPELLYLLVSTGREGAEGTAETARARAIRQLISGEESGRLEFKESLRWNRKASRYDKRLEYAVLKTVAGFLNTGGGTLVIGVKDDGTIVGIEDDGFDSDDRTLLHLTNIIRDGLKSGASLMRYIDPTVQEIDGKRVIQVECEAARMPAYVKEKEGEHLYVRTGPATNRVPASDIYEYVKDRFHSEEVVEDEGERR